MDIVWIAAIAVLWLAAAGMVAGLDRLARPGPAGAAAEGERP